MHFQQINPRNLHLACDLGTEFAMLYKIYYLLYGSEIFSDYLFLQEVTVLLMKFKKSSINALKLIPDFHIETGSVKLSDIFPLLNGLIEFCQVLSTLFT